MDESSLTATPKKEASKKSPKRPKGQPPRDHSAKKLMERGLTKVQAAKVAKTLNRVQEVKKALLTPQKPKRGDHDWVDFWEAIHLLVQLRRIGPGDPAAEGQLSWKDAEEHRLWTRAE